MSFSDQLHTISDILYAIEEALMTLHDPMEQGFEVWQHRQTTIATIGTEMEEAEETIKQLKNVLYDA